MNCKTWRDSVSNEGHIPLLIESCMAPLSNTVSASYFSIAFIRYMTESDVGRTLFCLGFHHGREFVWERGQQAGGTVSGSGSWELTPQSQAQREQTGSGAGQGTPKTSLRAAPASETNAWVQNARFCGGHFKPLHHVTKTLQGQYHPQPCGLHGGLKKGQPFGANWITGK